MGSSETCVGRESHAPAPGHGPSHASLPDALATKAGNTSLLLEGKLPRTYAAGATYRLTIAPGGAVSSLPTWFLVDSGVGTLSAYTTAVPDRWSVRCDGTRASFATSAARPMAGVDLLWTAPRSAAGAVALRVAAATAMGELTIAAVVLNA